MKNLISWLSILSVLSCTKESISTECQSKCSQVWQPQICVSIPPNGYYFDASTKKCIAVFDCENEPPFETREACESCGCK